MLQWVLATCALVLTAHLALFVWMYRYEHFEGRDWRDGIVRDRLTGRYCSRGYCFPSPGGALLYAENRHRAEWPKLVRKYRADLLR